MSKAIHYSENTSCRHCHNISKMEMAGSINHITNSWDGGHESAPVDFYDVYEFLVCPKCKKVNIRVYAWSDMADSDEGDTTQITYIYPTENKIPGGLPENIGRAYNAAEMVRNVDANAYATLLRRLLEMVCYDREANGDTLAEMLKDLAKKNEIPQKLVDVANGLRVFGNIGAHAGSGDLSSEEIPIVKALADAILEYVYSAPELASIAAKKLDEIKKKKADVKKKKSKP